MPWHFVIHEPTGVTRAIWTPERLLEKIDLLKEAYFILVEGKIAGNKKRRKRGIWQRDPERSGRIYFTCPWCGTIGRTRGEYVNRRSPESICCAPRPEGCGRHLFLYYRKKGEERHME